MQGLHRSHMFSPSANCRAGRSETRSFRIAETNCWTAQKSAMYQKAFKLRCELGGSGKGAAIPLKDR